MTVDPRVRAGMTAQHERWRAALRAGADRVGWKMGLNVEEVEAVTGGEPMTGYLTSATRLASGETYRAGGAAALRAETELALRIGGDGTAIDGLAVALELVDVGPPRGDVEPLLAANVFHRAFVLGAVLAPGPTGSREGRLWVDGELRGSGRLRGDYGDTLRAAARALAIVGESLEPGDMLICGSLVHEPVAPGEAVRVEIDGLGRVELTIAS